MKPRASDEFKHPFVGRWLQPDLLTDEVKGELLLHLKPAGMEAAAAKAFVGRCGQLAQMVCQHRRRERGQDVQKSLRRLSLAAAALQAAIEGLGCDALKQWYLADRSSSRAPRGAARHALSDLHSQARAADATSMRAAALVAVGNQPVTRDTALALVHLVAGEYRARFGRLPPSGKAAWFSSYMAALAQANHIECGSGVVQLAIRGLAVNPDAPP